jgi:cGMP-dependent protein kinase
LLNKNQVTRLSKISLIKSHKWLKDYDWNKLFSMEMQPPYVPKIKIKDEEYTKIPYLMYLKNTEKEKEKEKDKEKMSVDKKLQKQYDDWFKKF